MPIGYPKRLSEIQSHYGRNIEKLIEQAIEKSRTMKSRKCDHLCRPVDEEAFSLDLESR